MFFGKHFFILQIVFLPAWEYIYIYIKTEVSLGFLSSYKFGFNLGVFFWFLFFSLNRRRY